MFAAMMNSVSFTHMAGAWNRGSRSPRSLFIGVSAILGACVQPLGAQTAIDFSSTASSGSNWNTGANWVGGVAPANDLTTNIARFDQTSYANQPNAGSSRSIAGLQIGDGTTATAALTISGNALSVGASGITMSANAGASTVGVLNTTSLILGASQIWTNNSGNLLTIGGKVTGNFSVEQNGVGTIVLNDPGNTFTGGYTLDSGTVRLNGSSTAALGTGTATLRGGAVGSTSSDRTLANAVTLDGIVQLGITQTAGAVLFTGAVNVAGDSQLSLVNGGGAFNGNTVTLDGALTLDTAIATQVSGNNITSSIVDGSSAHGIVKNGTGIVVLSGANTYSGGTTINAGQIWAGSSSALGAGTATFAGGKLDLRGQNLGVGALAGGSGTITDTSNSGSRTLTVGQGGGSGSFSGNIVQASPSKIINIAKTGNGAQKFGGADTYIGQTTVSAGTLLINGTHIDASSTTTAVNGYGNSSLGHFQVESGAILGGSGRIQGDNGGQANSNLVLVKSGGHMAPGDGIGTLALDGSGLGGSGSSVLNMASGSQLDFQLSGTGGASDQVDFWSYVSGDLLLNNNALNLSLAGSLTAGTYTVDLFKFFSDSGTTATASSIGSGLVLGSLGSGISSATINYNATTIGLTYTVQAVPEVSSGKLLFGGLLLLLAWRGRRIFAS